MNHLIIVPVLLPAMTAALLVLLRPSLTVQRVLSVAATIALALARGRFRAAPPWMI